MPKPRKLTAKQAAFVREYLQDFNGTQAAIRAGYSPRTANEQAARLLANVSVSTELTKLQEQAKTDAILSLRELQEWWTDAVLGKHAELGAEYRDQQKASEYLARSQSGFSDRVDLTSGGQPLKAYIGFNPEDV